MGGTGVVAAFSLASAVIDAAEVAAAWWGLGLGLWQGLGTIRVGVGVGVRGFGGEGARAGSEGALLLRGAGSPGMFGRDDALAAAAW